ncbi:MAG: ankyrin repeat domain-containing protein [Clostridiales bacterium]|nr:ankyrin repeat domain-containing protein [Clostridiales bacterium]
MGKDVLNRFKVRFDDEPRMEVELTSLAFKSTGVQCVLEQIDVIDYTKEELAKTSDMLCELQDKILDKDYVKEYLRKTKMYSPKELDNATEETIKEVQNFLILENKDAKTIKTEIANLVKKLVDREKNISNARASDEVIDKDYSKMLKGYRIIAEILQKSSLDPHIIQQNLNMIAAASNVCSTGWKSTLMLMLTHFGDDISKKFEGIIRVDTENDELKKLLKKLFYVARKTVVEHISYQFLSTQAHYLGEEVHYLEFCKSVLNESYGLNLVDINVEDLFWGEEKREDLREKILNFVSKCNIHEIIYDRVYQLLYDELMKNGAVYANLADWASKYIKTNNLEGEVGDVTDFLITYVMTKDYKLRYVAIKEIIESCGFVKFNKCEIVKKSITDMERVIHDVKLDEEVEELNRFVLENINNSEKISFIINAVINFKNYDVLSGATIKALADANKAIVINYIAKTQKYHLLMEKDMKRVVAVALETSRIFFAWCYGYKDLEIVRFWLDYMEKEDLKRKMENGGTLLTYAINKGAPLDVVKLLVKAGSNVNEKDRRGWTSLIHAICRRESLDVIEFLLEEGANVNDVEFLKRTPLVLALNSRRSIDVIKLLLDKGARVDIKDIYGGDALIYAVSIKFPVDIIKLLLDKGADVNSKDKTGMNAFLYAIRNRADDKVIKLLLDRGADVNTKDEKGITPLVYAILNKLSDELILNLIDKGANVNENDNGNITPIIYAVVCKASIEVIKALIDKGANVNAEYDEGETLLMCAVSSSTSLEVVNLLIDKGADVNAKNKEGTTVLMYAVCGYNAKFVELLLKKKVLINEKNNEGETALDIARKEGKVEIVNMLEERQRQLINVPKEELPKKRRKFEKNK